MAPDRVEFRPTIDRPWLERAAVADPVAHAYALWDLDRFPGPVRFVSAVRAGATVAYLLVWQPEGRPPMVHWVGEAVEGLTDHLPARPVVVTGAEPVRDRVEQARGPALVYPILVEFAPVGAPMPRSPHDGQVRRLTRTDASHLAGLAEEGADVVAASYAHVDLDGEVVFGGFQEGRLMGVARAVVRLPRIWLVSGVFVRPSGRGQGWGLAVTRAVQAEARRAGAPTALFVREDNLAATAVYARLGFRPVERRVWLDCGLGLSP